MDTSSSNIEAVILPDWRKKIIKVFSDLAWYLMSFLIVPTFLVIFAQNSVPGDSFYPIKTGMESGFLALMSLFNKQAGFQIDYTQRRYQEAMKVLSSKYGVSSMEALFEQIAATEESIKNIKNPEEKRQLTEKYINTLLEINSGLKNKKSELAASTLAQIPVANSPSPASSFSSTSSSPTPAVPLPSSAGSILLTPIPTLFLTTTVVPTASVVNQTTTISSVSNHFNPSPTTYTQISSSLLTKSNGNSVSNMVNIPSPLAKTTTTNIKINTKTNTNINTKTNTNTYTNTTNVTNATANTTNITNTTNTNFNSQSSLIETKINITEKKIEEIIANLRQQQQLQKEEQKNKVNLFPTPAVQSKPTTPPPPPTQPVFLPKKEINREVNKYENVQKELLKNERKNNEEEVKKEN